MTRALLVLIMASIAWGQEVVSIWTSGAPGVGDRKNEKEVSIGAGDFERVTNIHDPTLTVYLPVKASGTGIVVCPGGGHRHLAVEHEGKNVARLLNPLGVAIFVLKYRLAKAERSTYTVDRDALADVKQAMRVVREHARPWGLVEGKLGLMGFSAGGEVVALGSSRFDVERGVSSRPDFQVLLYPGGNLNAIVYGKDAPPAFLLVADDDKTPAVAETGLYQSLKQAGVSAEVHIFESGGHGFGIKPATKSLVGRTWVDRLTDWMRVRGLLL